MKVEGNACGRQQDGSGFTVAPDIVVTNAHVVAGESRDRACIRQDGTRCPPTVVVFDPDRDLAVLRVPGLGLPPLPIGTASVGATGAVFGHPRGRTRSRCRPPSSVNGSRPSAATCTTRTRTRRRCSSSPPNLEPGDSGGGLVDAPGRVVGVAFAIAPDRPGTAYALTDDELNAVLARAAAGRPTPGPA